MNKEKMIKIAGRLDKVLKWIIWLNVILGIVAVLILALLIGWKEPFIQHHQVNLDYCTIVFAEHVRPELSKDDSILEILLCGLLIEVPIGIYGLMLLRRVLKFMKSGTPFVAECSASIKKIANIILIFGFVRQILDNILAYMQYQMGTLTTLIGAERIESITFEWGLDLTFLMFAATIYLLYYIFKYGEVLQQESDETL